VTSERVQFGDFNRTVYYTYDECGKLVSTTFSQPEVKIER
jgi:YD repeat-containing protein